MEIPRMQHTAVFSLRILSGNATAAAADEHTRFGAEVNSCDCILRMHELNTAQCVWVCASVATKSSYSQLIFRMRKRPNFKSKYVSGKSNFLYSCVCKRKIERYAGCWLLLIDVFLHLSIFVDGTLVLCHAETDWHRFISRVKTMKCYWGILKYCSKETRKHWQTGRPLWLRLLPTHNNIVCRALLFVRMEMKSK